ncbi:crotonase/enoyl-CoA hydratase family protein [Pseudomonas sp. NFACC13-1]|uniref:crotonase/enoyl-CoA hydratase family protein n=1 Tax=Pseudomonas sp. NFACC13-1 TaxID=1566245 RepID=UPI0008915AB2|nr:crotonase/enoyl-CoA hydratase family protein [Pseudomonas sp. NFACC13-1]SDB35111.1 Enoyl-CoA hydratase/carnithine racemase [Pseudomonas sp. NFACC13-1]
MMCPRFNSLFLKLDDDGIAVLYLNRPDKLNAFTSEMVNEFIAALDYTDSADSVRAVIVTGAGRAFCAGADLSAGSGSFDYDTSEGADEVFRDEGGLLTLRIFRSLKPIIAAVNGVAVGVGATLQLAMDVRLASSEARFGFVFARRGIVPEAASSWFLSKAVGISTALQWCYSGRLVNADEALARGLLHSTHAPEKLLDAAKDMARSFVEHSAPVSLAVTRQMIWRMSSVEHPMAAHQLDSRAVQDRGRSLDAREGIASFLEKRPANFPLRVSTDLPTCFDWNGEPEFH